MTENVKTGIFVGAAALLGLLAVASTPRQISNKDAVEEMINKPLFANFTDPNDVASLKIVKFDEELGTMKKFDLARDAKSGAWVIPSHDSYPADAASQVSKVANAFIDLKALTVAAKSASDHKAFGVIEPDDAKTQAGETGLGTLVSMENQKGEVLVNLVIGREVKDDAKQRFVRRAGSDPIFTAEIDPSILATDFEKWIEGDLLKLSSTDINNLTIRDYNIIVNNGRGLHKRNFNADLDYKIIDGKWQAKSIQIFDKSSPTERKLAEDEELNTTKLNEIKNTLDSLKIVDVARKPKGLAADLKADKELLDDQSAVESLGEKGFYVSGGADGKPEILSANGELIAKTKDGIEYLLRFGEAFGTLGSAGEGATKDDKSGTALYRTLFVTAKLDESQFPMPALAKVPETIEDLKAMEAAEREEEEKAKAAEAAKNAPSEPQPPTPPADVPPPADPKPEPAKETTPDALKTKPETTIDKAAKEAAEAKPSAEVKEASDAKATEAPKSSEPAADAPKPEKSDQSFRGADLKTRFVSTQSEGKEGAAKEAAETKSEVKTEAEAKPEPAKAEVKSDESETKPADKKEAGEKAVENKPAEAKADEAKPAAEAKKPEAETEAELKERLEARREQITKLNNRNIEDRNDQMEKARKKAAELNARFSDWYYEIADGEYKRLRVSLDDLIKKKAPEPAAETK